MSNGHGLAARPGLNGAHGQVVSWHLAKGRYAIQVEKVADNTVADETAAEVPRLLIQPANLRAVDPG